MNAKAANKKRSKEYKLNPNDVIYTPKPVAELMIKMCNIQPNDKVLDPSKGGGVFYDNIVADKSYCEIAEDIDFFEASGKYDLIIGNPPYSLWNDWLDKTMELTDKFCYIFGIMNFTHSRMARILNKGYVMTHYHLLKITYWFSHSVIVIFEKKPVNTHMTKFTLSPGQFECDKCGKRCGRGLKGQSYNKCYAKK
tara:strand:- start:348 stop:932 length:585 start_codon:yes stop_codon:yes gene_type:complete